MGVNNRVIFNSFWGGAVTVEQKEIKEYMDLRFLVSLNDGVKLRCIDWALNTYIQIKDIPSNYYLPISVFSKRSIKMYTLYKDEVIDIKDYFLTAYDLYEAKWTEYIEVKHENRN